MKSLDTHLAGIGHIVMKDRAAVLAALDPFDAGLDFATALRIARSRQAAGGSHRHL